jgi:hypothetical protein
VATNSIDSTIRIFDSFYDLDLVVNADQYEIVLSFFNNYTENDRVAKSFTQTIFRIANELQVNVLDLLQTFEGSDSLKVSLTMAYYLNSLSNKTIMYGVNNLIIPNETVQRNVVQ